MCDQVIDCKLFDLIENFINFRELIRAAVLSFKEGNSEELKNLVNHPLYHKITPFVYHRILLGELKSANFE